MNAMHVNVTSMVTRTQEISVYIPASEIEPNIDQVRIVISSDHGRPRSILLPVYFFDEARVYGA